MSIDMIVKFLFSVIRVSTPLIFGALAACITKKAGLMNLTNQMKIFFLNSAA